MKSDFSDVQKLVDDRYRGIVLDSAIQGWYYLGAYAEGVQAFKNLSQPTAADYRWLSACLLHTREYMQALEAAYKALEGGEEAARIAVARALDFLDRSTEATQERNGTDFRRLRRYDQAWLYRAMSLQEELNGNFKYAINYAEEAWRLIQGTPEFPVFAPWILIRLGRLHSQAGRAQRALWCFNRAEQLSESATSVYVTLSKILSLIDLGRLEEALGVLSTLSEASIANLKHLYFTLSANINLASQQIRRAQLLFERTVEEALATNTTTTEFLARLNLTSILGSQGKIDEAFTHLLRAQMLVNYKIEEPLLEFRETLFKYWAEDADDDQTLEDLERLSRDFGAMGLMQEQGWVRLHIAEIYRVKGTEQYRQELDKLQALSVVLQNRAFLAREWTLVPKLRELALLSHPKIAGETPVVLEIYTLGQEKLVLGGKVVNIRLRHGIELLAYFLEHERVKLRQVFAEVLPEFKLSSARSYFHQFRSEVKDRIPGLCIEYNAKEKVYDLKSKIDILWDAAELRAGRKMGDTGIFLPGSGNDWVENLDRELEPLRNRSELAGMDNPMSSRQQID